MDGPLSSSYDLFSLLSLVPSLLCMFWLVVMVYVCTSDRWFCYLFFCACIPFFLIIFSVVILFFCETGLVFLDLKRIKLDPNRPNLEFIFWVRLSLQVPNLGEA
jgi:hypothetical protein